MLHGTHYIGEDILAHFEVGETWTKVFGPFFVYLNSTPDVSKAHNLWIDTKKQVLIHFQQTMFNVSKTRPPLLCLLKTLNADLLVNFVLGSS